MTKTIKKFALWPVRVQERTCTYTIWLTNYYVEYTLQDVFVPGPSYKSEAGEQGSATLQKQWVVTRVYQ